MENGWTYNGGGWGEVRAMGYAADAAIKDGDYDLENVIDPQNVHVPMDQLPVGVLEALMVEAQNMAQAIPEDEIAA